MVINDVLKNGICNWPDLYSGQYNNDRTSCPPLFEGIFPINYDLMCEDLWNGNAASSCSYETESLLVVEECRKFDFKLDIITRTLNTVTEHSCSPDVYKQLFGFNFFFPGGIGTRNLELQNKKSEYHQTSNQSYRLPPIESVINYSNVSVTVKTELN